MKMNSQILKFMLIGLTADNESKQVIPTETMENIHRLIERLGYTNDPMTGMWFKEACDIVWSCYGAGIDCGAIIAYINSAVQSVLAEATLSIDKEWFEDFYRDWWLPLLNAATYRSGIGGWQFAGLSTAAFRRLEDEAYRHHRLPYAVYFALNVLRWLPIKMVVDQWLGGIYYTDIDVDTYQAMVDAEAPVLYKYKITDQNINEDNLMGLLGIKVNGHAKE
uniref:Uncharacterized protein n=1 Tax=Siphoviridae sp. ctn8e14 TaxID=2827936 RepID=A0A8S5T4M3_9CAUD|nr:MAG TPA: hypothetical protein [Siphoviridae sp. ctn8e14]